MNRPRAWRAVLCSFAGFVFFSSCAGLFELPPLPESGAGPTPTAVSSQTEPEMKKRVFVLDFQNRTPYGGETLSKEAASVLRESLSKVSQFVVVSSEELADVESSLLWQDPSNLKFLLENARAHGIHGLALGTVEQLSMRTTGDEIGLFRSRIQSVTALVRVKIIDTASERDVFSKALTGETIEEHILFLDTPTKETLDTHRSIGAVTKALEKMKPSLGAVAEGIAWQGRIAKIDLHRYYINSGELSGLRRGQLLKVHEGGQPVFDPHSGLWVGRTSGRIKGFLRVIDYFGKDGSVAIVLSGSGFREKDRVDLYSPPPGTKSN